MSDNLSPLEKAKVAFVVKPWNKNSGKIVTKGLEENVKKARIPKEYFGNPEDVRKKAKVYQDQSHREVVNNATKVLEKGNEKLLVEYAEIEGINCVLHKLTITQIRKFLDAIKKITKENFKSDEVVLLKPKLAYSVGRESKVLPLMEVLEPCIDKVNDWNTFKRFVQFIESIVAYHVYYGGRD